jgi:hypothetical protein
MLLKFPFLFLFFTTAFLHPELLPLFPVSLSLPTEFSPWMAEFEQSNQGLVEEYIEVPGQYTGLARPLPELHVRVASFDADVLVMGSLRKPKRVKMRGNDEKDYAFLVKGGEDLRLDQRVQQLFSVMNQIFSRDSACSKRGLAIKTFQGRWKRLSSSPPPLCFSSFSLNPHVFLLPMTLVVPMTTKVGVIEWVDGTQPLRDIIEEEIVKIEGKEKKDVSILKIPAAQVHDQWIKSFKSDKVTFVYLLLFFFFFFFFFFFYFAFFVLLCCLLLILLLFSFFFHLSLLSNTT